MMVHVCLVFACALAGLAQSAQERPFDPALVNVDRIAVAVEVQRHPASEPNDSKVAARLSEGLRTLLGEADISVVDANESLAGIPVLQVAVDLVPFKGAQELAVYVRTSLARQVSLYGHSLPATVWCSRPCATPISTQRWQEGVEAAVTEQVDAFAAARRLAAPHDGETAKSVREDAVTALGCPYVASKGSTVFHRADCRMAGNIASENLIGYNSRDDAVAAGKRPCKTCSP